MSFQNGELKVSNLDKSYIVDNKQMRILDNVNFSAKKGEFVSIIGHSGCGKSTLLKIIAGLVGYNVGSVVLNGSEIKEVVQNGTDVGMVFQDHRLLPWLTVKENIKFGLYGISKEEEEKLVMDHIELVGLKGFENAYPKQLSGGMAQRAAIARALVHRPKVLLLDEPFGALDALTRLQMQKEILKIWQKEKTTMLLVTHDIDEAIYLSDKILIMSSRPSEVKIELDIELERPRDRNSNEFSEIRKKIYTEFFGSNYSI